MRADAASRRRAHVESDRKRVDEVRDCLLEEPTCLLCLSCELRRCSWRTGGRLLLLLWGAVLSRGVFVLRFGSLGCMDAAGSQSGELCFVVACALVIVV